MAESELNMAESELNMAETELNIAGTEQLGKNLSYIWPN